MLHFHSLLRMGFRRTIPALAALLMAGGMLAPLQAQAQQRDSTRVQRRSAPSVFLDCDACDERYIRRTITFVNYVRNRQQADVHVLVTNQQTGAGGSRYRLDFIGRRAFTDISYVLTYTTSPTDTEVEEERGLAQILKIGLSPYVSQTPLRARLSLLYDEEGTAEDNLFARAVDDPWNNWVFEVELSGGFQVEQRQSEYSLDGELSADRVTREWRIHTELGTQYDEDNFEEEGTVISSISRQMNSEVSVVRSLTDHWSAGAFGNVFSNTVNNMNLSTYLTPALEYNVFPYEISDRKELTIAYRVGPRWVNYREVTLFGKTEQLLVEQSLDITFDVEQPWGSAEISLEGSHYLHDFSKNRLDFSTDLNLRLVEGLSLNVELEFGLIHDQLHIPRGDATLEEILLQRRDLLTAYEFETRIGFSYTFGSIYNNIVNSRL